MLFVCSSVAFLFVHIEVKPLPLPVRVGTDRATVERLLGRPPFGEERFGDSVDGVRVAHYRTGPIETITYKQGKVHRIEYRTPRSPADRLPVPPTPPPVPPVPPGTSG